MYETMLFVINDNFTVNGDDFDLKLSVELDSASQPVLNAAERWMLEAYAHHKYAVARASPVPLPRDLIGAAFLKGRGYSHPGSFDARSPGWRGRKEEKEEEDVGVCCEEGGEGGPTPTVTTTSPLLKELFYILFSPVTDFKAVLAAQHPSVGPPDGFEIS